MTNTYKYPRPAITVDCVVFGYDGNELNILLIKRGIEPFVDCWALPGGFVRHDETIDEAAKRELLEETFVKNIYLEQLYTFGDLYRDPRERVISVSYFALVRQEEFQIKASTDANEVAWFKVQNTPALAFDHENILEMALKRLKNKVRYEPIGFELLPPKFPFSALEQLYESIIGKPLDRRNFRNKFQKMGLLTKLSEKQEKVAHKRGFLYQFDSDKYEQLKKDGFEFAI